jgi:hypothetical protein
MCKQRKKIKHYEKVSPVAETRYTELYVSSAVRSKKVWNVIRVRCRRLNPPTATRSEALGKEKKTDFKETNANREQLKLMKSHCHNSQF